MEPTPRPVEVPHLREAVYEPPMLLEVGAFDEVTRGAEDRPSDYPSNKRGYWLI